MTLTRKRAPVDNKGANGLYVHSNPPRILSISAAHIKQLIRNGDIEKLEQVVLEGQGKKLVGEYSADYKTRMFLKSVPALMSKISLLHDSLNSDRLSELQSILDEEPERKKKLAMAKDESGVGLLHKAVYYDLKSIYRWLIDKFPHTVNLRDSEGRTAYFYSLMCKEPGAVQKLLTVAGADPYVQDYRQHSTKYYQSHMAELELPSGPKSIASTRKNTACKESLNFKKSNIRIWLHQRNMSNLQQVVWEGYGPKLLVEHSNNPKMRKFLEAVPYIMGVIKDVHCDVQNDDLDSLKNRIAPPVPLAVLTAKDTNGLTPLHKAVGLGKAEIAKYIIERVPNSISMTDNEGRTPLHYTALLKDDQKMFNFLIENGADESALDNRQKTAAYYKTRTSELDSKLLHVVPDCPRGAKEPTSFDWSMLTSTAAALPMNGVLKKAAEKIENDVRGVNDKLIQEDSSGSKENEVPNESPEEKIKTEEDPAENETVNGDVLEENGEEGKPENIIEGVVNGEDEVEPVNNEGQTRPITNDDDIKSLINSGNMEQLAALVLNGEGEKLVGEKSDNQELQAFLDNVPVYMSKIKRIHEAAREGSLRDLQAALDRRKFAVARDSSSPNGATPLHVAVAFGRTSVVRYLAGRFPETVHVEDDNGRSSLHYAAVLRDNGHYYNLLIHLGADNRIKDKFGNTPEYYMKNQSDFNHRQILLDFGAQEEADEILNDKEVTNAEEMEENGQVDMPFFATEEGRYLASSPTSISNNIVIFSNKEGQHQQIIIGDAQTANENQAVPATIDVVTVEPDDGGDDESAFNSTSRDEHGQSMIHFAASRAHGRNALFQLLLESEANIAYRDELYRTARDISIQANVPENTVEIDRYVLNIATNGDTSKLVELLLNGYDHITDIVDEDETPIIDIVAKANQSETVSFLQSILAFEEKRERVHHAIRQGSFTDVMALLADENDTGSGKLLAIGKNSYGRCSLHIAVLCQQEEIVDYLANTFSDTLRIGDNLERTALHYAMGVEKMETITRVLIKAGAKRVVKDLKGRQPTYYFLNKSDILRLQEEEETF
ncbi:unnamed protein product [Ceutorhynchus assimilis]|uniref:Uncharacterized protein n=1 Tax=Ceutorhynchus assimilis TaxID=467358 RepID=A0A9N9MBQ4_9CUCU|nr:unnamed protein product [Ceutorhynchus assimilis]